MQGECGHNFVCYVITRVITRKRQTGRMKSLKGLVIAARTKDTHILYFVLSSRDISITSCQSVYKLNKSEHIFVSEKSQERK